ncbi:hypothetical protein B0A48_17571 [Cryoendolithus antarcticus]|uniref:Luciferase-like domain-containing protein n=1 Tax=Cryoendolithus antarcticus TaxID=1507870 RepID=A0A1V8SAY6_9PEZI|nr:hypothetical protein B0A48_17571 [Cryoendolithus antarcticus]
MSFRRLAKEAGRDAQSIKFFSTFTPFIGRTDEDAHEKYNKAKKYASTIGGLVLASGWTGIDFSQIPIDQPISEADSKTANKIVSILSNITTTSEETPVWTPRVVAEKASLGGLGPLAIGSPVTVADEMERWMREADLDGFNVAYVTTPGTFEDVVELLVPELRCRGLYKKSKEGLTARERIYGAGQKRLRDDHFGSTFAYKEDEIIAGVNHINGIEADASSDHQDPISMQLG